MSGKANKKNARGNIKKAAKKSGVPIESEDDIDDTASDDTSEITPENLRELKRNKKLKLLSPKGFLDEFVYGWANGRQDEAMALLRLCKDVEQARTVMANCSLDDWKKHLKPWYDEHTDFDLGDDEAIRNKLADLKIGETNRALQARQRLLSSLETYDKGSHTAPGHLLTDVLENDLVGSDVDWSADWKRIRTIDKGLADLMIDQDAAYAAAEWELEQNKSKIGDLPEYKELRKRQMAEARTEINKLVVAFKEQRRIFELKEASNTTLEGIESVVDAIITPLISGNALCTDVWNCAKANKGTSGYIELSGSYSASAIKEAWKKWGTVQSAIRSAPVAGFATHRLGKDGTAQDKRDRPDITSRNHTHQKNFSVTWRGVEQMIHVGLEGTRRT